MLVINGKRDRLLAPSWIDKSVESSCKLGGNIQHAVLPNGGHGDGLPYNVVGEWFERRFAGDPAQSSC